VSIGEVLAEIHTNKEHIIKEAETRILNSYKIIGEEVSKKKNILGVME